jgi:hypothetical protein
VQQGWLIPASGRQPASFSKEAMIRFNLACYASVSGRIAETKNRLGPESDILIRGNYDEPSN